MHRSWLATAWVALALAIGIALFVMVTAWWPAGVAAPAPDPRQVASAEVPAAAVPVGARTAVAAVAPEAAPVLPSEASGHEAIEMLGDDLPAVATANGKSAKELKRALEDDGHLVIDRSGRLLYRDAAPRPGDTPMNQAADAAGAPFALDQTFRLHSKPASKKIIYLDFDGQVLSGTAWNSDNGGADIIAPPFDFEGGSSVFTDNEKTRIQLIWQRVAEDYAPFDVDVTTELISEDRITRTDSSDQYFGMRTLISPISSYFGNYGGIAYVGVFDAYGDAYKPALVFPEKLGNSDKYVAEAASHETGHTLGLLHDGTTSGTEYYAGHGSGETGWAPIMGNGYYQNVTQFSKGEYANANNTEDDLAVIQQNGAALVADDHGDTVGTATKLPSGTTLTASGTIGRTADVDVVAVTAGAGPLSVAVAPSALGPDLDIAVEVRDAAGTVVASANPADKLAASLTTTVSAGTYYVAVRGTGKGDASSGYSSYASLGAWTLTGSAADPGGAQLPPVAVATVSPSSGSAPLAVGFDGTGSYDPDGSVVAWAWDFGDGTTASGATASHTYTAAGSYSAVLTVTDSTGRTASTSKTISVLAPNVAPTASMQVSPSSGTAPLPVTFDGSGSADVDGSIVSWNWSFGDGGSASGRTASHTYSAAGTYTARLTVTDDRGATATTSSTVVVTAAPAIVVHVESISLSVNKTRQGSDVRATVRIVDASGKAVSGATVAGSFAGAVTGTASGLTDANGTVTLKSKRFKRSGVVTFTVTSVAKTGFVYDPSKNVVSSASIAAGTSTRPRLRR